MPKQAPQSRLNESQLETVLATIPVGVVITDADGCIISSNKRALDIWGGPPPLCHSIEAYAQFKGWRVDTGEELAPQDWPAARALLKGEIVEGELLDGERFDGTRSTILNSAAPLRDEHGNITGSVTVMQDVSDQRDRQRRTELLLSALSTLSESLELRVVLDRLVQVLLDSGSHTRAGVLLWDEATEELELAAVAGEPRSEAGTRLPLSRVSSVMRGVVTNRRRAVVDFDTIPAEERGLAGESGLVRTLIVPLVRSGELLGVVSVDETRPEVPFVEQEIAVVEGIAAQAALAIENARLYEAQRHIAVTLQEALLSVPSSLDRISYAHAYRSASEEAFVGGDFYDIFEMGRDLIGILIGDIAGKGVEAAVLTQLVKNTVRAHAAEKGASTGTILALTNDIFFQTTGPESFVTVFFGVLNRRSGLLTYTNGGHTTAFILQRDGQVTELPADSPLLGAFPDREFAQSNLVLEPHSLLVLYTDGVTEARAAQRQYGEARLLATVSGLPDRRPAVVVRTIIGDVLAFAHGALTDDLAVLALERLEDAEEHQPGRRLEVTADA